MKKLVLFGVMFCLLFGLAVPVFAWGPTAHKGIANRLMEDPDIQYEIKARQLRSKKIANAAAPEPPSGIHHPGWGNIGTEAALNGTWMQWPINDTYCGYLLHVIADCAVPVCHSPASEVWCHDLAEANFEVQGEGYGIPSWPAPYGVSKTDYDGYCAAFHSDAIYWAGRYHDHWYSYWVCQTFGTCQTDWIDPYCKENALQLGWEVFWWYLAYHP
jgi:hypothetical protein